VKLKYKILTTVFTDDNVVLHSEKDLFDSFDFEVANSLLFSLFLTMSVCYMRISHFKEAESALEDAG